MSGRPPRVGVVIFPGSNCDRDALAVVAERVGEAVPLWHEESDLRDVQAVIVPGGFSYGDALRAGAIARFAPIMPKIADFAASGGLTLGICNGFQILCEAGLLPGALVRNAAQKFVCRTIHLRVENNETPFTSGYSKGDVLRIPIAHGEGRYVCDEATLAQLQSENRILFRYCDEGGHITDDANPNGSLDNIAGIVGGARRNILGMMPHPERASDCHLGSEDGAPLWEALRRVLEGLRMTPVEQRLVPLV